MKTLRTVLTVATLTALGGCSTEAQSSRQPAPDDVVARVGSTAITLAEIDEQALTQVAGNFGSLTLAQALYEARRSALEDAIGNHLIDQEAKTRGVERADLIKTEIDGKVTVPTEVDVAAWYQANQARVQGAPLEKVAAPIRSVLVQERTLAARQVFLDALKAKTAVSVALEPPRLKVADGGRPARGPAAALVQIIEFSDFECPFCLRAHPTVLKVLSTYGDKVRLVYRHYPLPNHPNARPAAEASACADEQGKFWEFHDRLFENQTKLTAADLKQYASTLGLDSGKFNACFDSHKFAAQVEDDMEAGEAVGVSGTPAFFINGRVVSGAQPFEVFKRIIDEELARR